MQAYVYAITDPPEKWPDRAKALGDPLYHWVADASRLTMGRGIPEECKGQGAVFGPKGELRWWKADDGYRALLLTDAPVDNLAPVSGEWIAEEEYVHLQNLNDRRLKPNFNLYPHEKPGGRIRARVYLRDGVLMFVSPRSFEES